MNSSKRTLCLVFLLILTSAAGVRGQSNEDEGNGAGTIAAIQKQLASRDPLVRQRAAEELAQLADPANRKLLEGYRHQEKNTRVKLALDWALYRIGKTETLFAVVRALDSSRADQSSAYLSTLDTPDPLYLFLERMNGNTQVKLLEVLAKIGDAATLDKLKPHSQSPDPRIAEAAQLAEREIEGRLGQTPANNSTRPRQVGSGEVLP
jgi:HEAT repeat protein